MIGQTSTGASSLTATGSGAASLITAAGTAVSADSVGRVRLPYQPAFHVRLTNAGTYVQTSPLQFTQTVFDIGSNFNTSTYRFTAPVGGRYGFLFNGYFRLNVNGENGVFGYRVNSSNRQYVEVAAPTATTYMSPSINAIFDLSAGDYVDIRFSGSGDYYQGNEEANFYGWFIG
jgi:hypothetical protein